MITSSITPYTTSGWSVVDWNEGLASVLTFESKYSEPGAEKIIKCYRREGNLMLVPRGALKWGEDNTVFKIPSPTNMIVPPRDEEQLQLIAKSVDLLQQGKDHIFEAPTGFGKSYCGAAIACQLGQPTIILVTKSDLMVSWKKTLIELGGVPESLIGIAKAGKLIYKGCKFVLATVQSVVIEGKYDQNFFNHFGMVIFDEVHRMGAPYFNKACGAFPARHRLGLSATPTRKDKLDPVFTFHIGPILVKGVSIPMEPKILVEKTDWDIPSRSMYNPKTGESEMIKIPFSGGRMMHIYKIMAANSKRNSQIVNFASQAYKAGRRILILSDLIDDHLVPLFHLLHQAGVAGEDMGYYISGKSKAELESVMKKRVTLATFGMCSEGTDNPLWDTLIMALPKATVTQPLGRILRKAEGKKTPICFDLVDKDSIFKGYYASRLKDYYKVHAEVVNL